MPVQKAPKGVPIIQWEKDATEDSGLVKIDLLGNRSLGVIRDAIANLSINKIPIDESQWAPEDNIATQKNVSLGKTMGCFYSTFAYVSEARRLGVEILPPDVNKSDIAWVGQDYQLRVGLLSLKHLSAKTEARMVAGRQKGPYTSITDFLKRVRPDEPEARALIHSGAFDSLHPDTTRAELLWALLRWHGTTKKIQAPPDLFAPQKPPARPQFPPQNKIARLRREFGVLGFLCDRHPMTLFNEPLKGVSIVKAKELKKHIGRKVQVAGLLITGKVVSTKKGEPMEFLTFEDETGLMECTFFPQAYRRFCAILDKSRPFILSAKVEADFGAVTLTVSGVRPVAISPSFGIQENC